MRLRDYSALFVLLLTLAACGNSATATADSDDPLYALDFVLPGFPDDIDEPFPVASVGEPVDPARLNSDAAWLWCQDREDGLAYTTAVVGDAPNTLEGTGIVIQIRSDLAPGVYDLSAPQEDFVFFVIDFHGDPQIPEEYSSTTDQTSGTITIESNSCGGSDSELSFSVDGALGAERSPGFDAAIAVGGEFRVGETDPPPNWLLNLFG